MPQHKDLTGSDLHEPKGIESASNGQIYVTNGSGSGSWKTLGTESISSSIKNINRTHLVGTLNLSSTASTLLIPFTFSGTVTRITGVISGALSGATTNIDFSKNGTSSLGTLAAVVASSAKGVTYTLNPAGNNTFVTGDRLEFNSAGGTTTAQTITFLIEVSLT